MSPRTGPCTNCGEPIAWRGLAAHQRGGNCFVHGRRRAFEARGLVPIDSRHADWLLALGVTCEEGPRAFHRGGQGRKSAITYAAYVPALVALIVTHVRIPLKRRRTAVTVWMRLPAIERDAVKAAVALQAPPADPAATLIQALEAFEDA